MFSASLFLFIGESRLIPGTFVASSARNANSESSSPRPEFCLPAPNLLLLFAYCTLNVYIVLLCKLNEFSNAFRVTFTSSPSTGS